MAAGAGKEIVTHDLHLKNKQLELLTLPLEPLLLANLKIILGKTVTTSVSRIHAAEQVKRGDFNDPIEQLLFIILANPHQGTLLAPSFVNYLNHLITEYNSFFGYLTAIRKINKLSYVIDRFYEGGDFALYLIIHDIELYFDSKLLPSTFTIHTTDGNSLNLFSKFLEGKNRFLMDVTAMMYDELYYNSLEFRSDKGLGYLAIFKNFLSALGLYNYENSYDPLDRYTRKYKVLSNKDHLVKTYFKDSELQKLYKPKEPDQLAIYARAIHRVFPLIADTIQAILDKKLSIQLIVDVLTAICNSTELSSFSKLVYRYRRFDLFEYDPKLNFSLLSCLALRFIDTPQYKDNLTTLCNGFKSTEPTLFQRYINQAILDTIQNKGDITFALLAFFYQNYGDDISDGTREAVFNHLTSINTKETSISTDVSAPKIITPVLSTSAALSESINLAVRRVSEIEMVLLRPSSAATAFCATSLEDTRATSKPPHSRS